MADKPGPVERMEIVPPTPLHETVGIWVAASEHWSECLGDPLSGFHQHTLLMKFLEIESLDALNSVFEWETAECVLQGRLEAYSCKIA